MSYKITPEFSDLEAALCSSHAFFTILCNFSVQIMSNVQCTFMQCINQLDASNRSLYPVQKSRKNLIKSILFQRLRIDFSRNKVFSRKNILDCISVEVGPKNAVNDDAKATKTVFK